MAVPIPREAMTGTAYGLAAILIMLVIGYGNGQKAMPELASVTAPMTLTVNDPVRRMAQDWNAITRVEDGMRLPIINEQGQSVFSLYHRPASQPPVSPMEAPKPRIAIMVMGLGFDRTASQLALASLPPEAGIALSPLAPYREDILSTLRNDGRELWLHAPSDSVNHAHDEGDQTLIAGVPATLNIERLHQALGSLTHYAGITLSPDSKVATSMDDMEPLMEDLGRRGIGFARLSASPSLMLNMNAVRQHVPFIPSAVSLSDVPLSGSIQNRLAVLLQTAKESGFALGVIDEPNPIVLKEVVSFLAAHQSRDITLVPPSALATDTQSEAELGPPPSVPATTATAATAEHSDASHDQHH